MHLPSAETINNLRMNKFAEKITETLASEDVSIFRDLIANYESEHDVPAAEIAAALAVMAQGGRPLLVQDLPEAPKGQRERAGGKKDGFGSRGPSRPLTEGNATYRIAVGRRQRVMPGSIVGALANEGGLTSAQIGGIDIRSDHSLVELPSDLSQDQLRALSKTRIGGELIHLELDSGRKPRRDREDFAGSRGGYGERGGFKKKFDGDRGGYKKKYDGERGFGKDRADRGESRFGHGAGARKPRHSSY
jgi:ATP-dependent RNA helicase DeaD